MENPLNQKAGEVTWRKYGGSTTAVEKRRMSSRTEKHSNKSYSYCIISRVSEYDNNGWLLAENDTSDRVRLTSELFVVVPVESTMAHLITLVCYAVRLRLMRGRLARKILADERAAGIKNGLTDDLICHIPRLRVKRPEMGLAGENEYDNQNEVGETTAVCASDRRTVAN